MRRRARTTVGVTLVSMVATVVMPTVAVASITDDSQYEEDTSASAQKQEIASLVSFDLSKNGSGKFTGPVTPVGNWSPPACWYEPRYTPEQKEEQYRKLLNTPGYLGKQYDQSGFESRFIDGNPYTDFNKEKSGDGMFWTSVRDINRVTEDAIWDCDEPDFWVDNGDTPDVENSIDAETLAALAYNEIRVPDTKVTLAPAGPTKVNLPTWAWLDKGDFREVSVTASLAVAGWNISATTTAKPISLKLEPGTTDAVTSPASGECVFEADGSIGEPYALGKAGQTPPCGITYLRSSNGGSYQMRATITWEITWTGTNGEGGRFDNGTFGTTQDVIVQEAQAVNR